jgi:hypothetical protein
MIALLMAAFGGAIELSQAIPFIARDAEWADWFADCAAVCVGTAGGVAGGDPRRSAPHQARPLSTAR